MRSLFFFLGAAATAFVAPSRFAGVSAPRGDAAEAPRSLGVVSGIPKMFRWLTDQYPSIMERVSDGLPQQGSRGAEIDNLYLDMNGIIHMCTHANDPDLVLTAERDMFVRIFTFTDKICKLVRPSGVIYLAVDGVAPRAKMNQQRSRRFRSALEREELLAARVAEGGEVASDIDAFDSNCITPGTEFMHKLGVAFRAWLAHKVENDPFYRDGPELVFSGPDVPGEGEHKVMDYIRDMQATNPAWAGRKLKHCFYGLDADLIMLSLVTHEPNFRLLREKMSVRHVRRGKKPKDPLEYQRFDFELLEVGLLREMLQLQFRPDPASASKAAAGAYDLERIVDDFVFVCMLVGNDFLPNVPHLDIADGSLDLMMAAYRELLPTAGGYLTDKERIHLPRLELMLRALAGYERTYWARRGAAEGDAAYGSDAYADRYYADKFGLAPGDAAGRRKIVADYVLGLFWCVQYYHRGVTSWDWFYPHLYAPLASDLVDLADLDLEFPSTDSAPFPPLMQLMSVLPAASARLLPAPYGALMTGDNSPLTEFYPPRFDVDANGKHASWEALVLIPFIEETVLFDTLAQIDHVAELSPRERARNDVDAASVWASTDAKQAAR